MFDTLSDRLRTTLRSLRGRGMISENHIKDAVREIRMALLSADVNVSVVRDLIARLTEKTCAEACLKSLTPAEQFTRIVYEELVQILGGESVSFEWRGNYPLVVLLAGLQGSGKTTTVAKLALQARRDKRRPLLVPLDLQRPAAIAQLTSLGKSLEMEVYPTPAQGNVSEIARTAVAHAKQFGFDTVFLDTAGRLAIDDALMTELKDLAQAVTPDHRILVMDAMAGQSGLSTGKGFDDALQVTGVILSKMDSDARGGVALSLGASIRKPILFVGTGEKPTDLEKFHPDRLASRILGMGDVASLVERFQEEVDTTEMEVAAKGMMSGRFTLTDLRKQLQMMGKLGGSFMKYLPGMDRLAGQVDSDQVKTEVGLKTAIIDSMTAAERENPKVLNGSRRQRIARGSGRSVQDVNRLIKEFEAMQKMMKQMRGGKMQALKQLLSR